MNDRLRKRRIECNMSQEQLAKIVGVARQTINMLEAEKYNPSLKLCIDICKALNRTLDELFWN